MICCSSWNRRGGCCSIGPEVVPANRARHAPCGLGLPGISDGNLWRAGPVEFRTNEQGVRCSGLRFALFNGNVLSCPRISSVFVFSGFHHHSPLGRTRTRPISPRLSRPTGTFCMGYLFPTESITTNRIVPFAIFSGLISLAMKRTAGPWSFFFS